MKHLGPPGPFPKRVTVGNEKKQIAVDPTIYFLATRMVKSGRLIKGQPLMLAATLAKPKGKRK